jgi:hypothetical protein
MQPLISIVIPVYNVAEYVDKCIQSALSQTYSNIEVIIVDDGSTDNSGKLCLKYATDKRVKVVQQANRGLSAARNTGKDYSSGDYITFIDGDDYVHHRMVEMLFDNIRLCNSSISTCRLEKVYDKGIAQNTILDERNIERYNYVGAVGLENLMYQKNVAHNSVAKLYDIRLFDKIMFPVDRICEDLGTTYKLFALSQSVSVSSAKLYYYYQRDNSIINSRFSKKRMDGLIFAEEQLEFVRQYYPDILNAAKYGIFVEAVNTLSIMPNSQEFKPYMTKCLDVIIANRSAVILSKKSTLHYKVHGVASFFGYINAVRLQRVWLKIKKTSRG